MKTKYFIALLILCGLLIGCNGIGNKTGQGTDEPGSTEPGTSGPGMTEPGTANPGSTGVGSIKIPKPDPLQKELEESTATGAAQFLMENIDCDVPDEMTVGDFDIYLGHGGGYPIFNGNGEKIGEIEIFRRNISIFENGQFQGVDSIAHRSSFEFFKPVEGDVPCVVARYVYEKREKDDSGTYQHIGDGYRWYAFWAKENMEPVYAVYLDADAGYEERDLIKLVERMTFSEGAFVTAEQEDRISAFYKE